MSTIDDEIKDAQVTASVAEAAAFRAAGLAMVPLGGDDVEPEYFEWHPCEDQPNCFDKRGQPCACAGMPWPGAVVQAAVRAGVEAATPIIRAQVRADVAEEMIAEAHVYRRLAADARDRRDDGDPNGERHMQRFLAQAVALEQFAREHAAPDHTTVDGDG